MNTPAPRSKARFLPWAVAWTTLLMSARVWDLLPKGTAVASGQVIFTFLGIPLIALAVVLTARATEKRTGVVMGKGSALVLAWVVAFLAAIHAFVLALALGKLKSLAVVLPPAIAVFFVGLGPLMALLEPSSAMGIRTRATLASEAAWRKTHVLLGVSCVFAGGVGIAASLFGLEASHRLLASVLSGVLALGLAIAHGTRRRT